MNTQPLALETICRVLEIDVRDVPDLATLKAKAKAQRKVLARKYHPDRGGAIETMQEINRVADHVARSTQVLAMRTPPEILRTMAQRWAAQQGVHWQEFDPLAWQRAAAAQQQAAYQQAQTSNSSSNPTPGFTYTWP